ncbi:MAG: hypothetical protein DLM60_22280 [Pseudonocardiales bacterium]|nr:MAG: hypothetical protein DLM60_22280 [Pseudonocardiales bacterium]
MGSFIPAEVAGGDKLDLSPFADLGYSAEYTAELHAPLSRARYSSMAGTAAAQPSCRPSS